MKEIEEWKDVVGYEEYFKVSNLGQIFSKRSDKILKQCKSKTGYWLFSTRLFGRDGGAKCFRVHVLVAKAFVKNPDNKPIVNHLDGDKGNKNYKNLEWCTYRENFLHAQSMGLIKESHFSTCKNPSIKITKEQADFIKLNYVPRDKKFGARAIGRMFGVGHNAVLSVVDGTRTENYASNHML